MTEEQSANESSSSEPSENVKTVSLHDVGKARVICQHELNPSVDLVYLCVMTLTLGSICAIGLSLRGADAISFLCIAGMFYGLFTSFRAFGEIVKAKTSFNSNLQSALDDTPGTTILKYVAYLLCTIAFWMLLKSLSWTSFITEGVVFGGMGQLEFGGFGLYSFWKWTLNKVRCLTNQQHRRTSLLFLPLIVELIFLVGMLWIAIFKIKAGQ
ncbi:MAG: hypothetical protein QG625_3519 [Cyanobacteriota bacterium erpe_2018_sw_39hr_WHONDRS-SW48-000098_B_bin.30]|jgi:hypothetical protein|nr:hypothetical protein [Candidatus Obscuribacter sp.]MDQ5967363.1 hypothetical protein [Cyanobacteriota bacterium erpe_2018_sw_39hr_WHONDRS-SW48-000098_B_bin.30]